jgi:hypothetical protein
MKTTTCPATWGPFTSSEVYNERREHECEQPEGHEGLHECECGDKALPASRVS